VLSQQQQYMAIGVVRKAMVAAGVPVFSDKARVFFGGMHATRREKMMQDALGPNWAKNGNAVQAAAEFEAFVKRVDHDYAGSPPEFASFAEWRAMVTHPERRGGGAGRSRSAAGSVSRREFGGFDAAVDAALRAEPKRGPVIRSIWQNYKSPARAAARGARELAALQGAGGGGGGAAAAGGGAAPHAAVGSGDGGRQLRPQRR
jgi:hypothetical protein